MLQWGTCLEKVKKNKINWSSDPKMRKLEGKKKCLPLPLSHALLLCKTLESQSMEELE